MKRLFTTLALAAAALSCAAQDAPTLERRVASVATLIESSSAARQIESSGVAAAREKRDNARLIHREAAATLRAGDSAGAARLLDQAAREMMNGVRLAKPEEVQGQKDRRDFDARMDSARALLAAQQRITAEKGSQAEAREATLRIEQAVAQAERLAAAGQIAQARPLVDRAYLSARVSIEAMRRGDTLVRSLTFASPSEEYAYEVDRNDTHRMLVDLVLAERRDVAPVVQPLLDKAGGLRREAEAQAQRGEHDAAIRTLEAATRELVRAVRAGGIYIPG
jgi:tetratricopeptide (TPR) repeat protein